MKIIIEPQNSLEELLVKILCKEQNEEVDRLYQHINNYAQPIWVMQDGSTHKLYETDIYYIDTVEGITFFYTENEIYETKDSLATVEQNIKGRQFVRISKNCIINIDYLQKVAPYTNHRLLAYMENGEKLIVGRTYIQDLKTIVKKGK